MAVRECSCCFTGHRPVRLPWGLNEADPGCIDLKSRLCSALRDAYNHGFRHFICGMALGCDTYFAEAVLELKKEYGGITLEAAVPCDNQSERWNRRQRDKYNSLLEACDSVTYVSHQYSPDCMMKRNQYMIDHSALLIACFNGQNSGTMNTILYAERSGVKSVILEI